MNVAAKGPTRRACRAFACALLLAGLGASLPANAAEPSAAERGSEPCGGAGPDTLEVVLDALPSATAEPGRGGGDPLPALERAICDWFRDDHWRVRFPSPTRLPEMSGARTLRIILELKSAQGARLHAEGPSGRWTHDVPLQAGLDDAGIEALAEALHSTAQAESAPLIHSTPPPPATAPERARAVPKRVDAEPTPLEPAPVITATGERAPAPRPRVAGRQLPVHIALGYQAYARGPEPFMHGPALHIELDAVSRAVTLGAYFRASLFSSATRHTTGFDVRSSGASLSVGGAASVPLVAGLTARAGAGGGLDLVAVAARVNDPELVRLLPGRNASPRPYVNGEAGLRYRLGALEIGLDALLRLLLIDTQYQVLGPDGPVPLFRPWQLQPGALLELGYVW